jgi:hypothetical protein
MSIFVEPVLGYAKFYEELAMACSDEELALEFRRYSRQCAEVASMAVAFGVTAAQHLGSCSPACDSAQMLQ